MTGGTQEQGQGQIGGSVLSRTIAGKVVEERPRETGLGTLAGGRRVLVPGGGSSHFHCGITFFLSLALGLEGSPLSQAQAKDVSSASHPSPSISSSQERRPQRKEMGRGEGRGKAHATAPSQQPGPEEDLEISARGFQSVQQEERGRPDDWCSVVCVGTGALHPSGRTALQSTKLYHPRNRRLFSVTLTWGTLGAYNTPR